jgi:hypothetical protein
MKQKVLKIKYIFSVECFFRLGKSPASEFCRPKFGNTLSHAGELPRKKKHTTCTTQRKFEFKNIFYGCIISEHVSYTGSKPVFLHQPDWIIGDLTKPVSFSY